MKINYFSCFRFIFLSLYFILGLQESLGLNITDIIYNPDGTDTGKEWFRVCNDGSDINNFTNYKAITTPISGSNLAYSSHSITGVDVFLSNTCAAITQNNTLFTNNINSSDLIFDSSWSDLNNTGGFVGILLEDNMVTCKSYGTGVCPTTSNSTTTNSTSTNATTTTSTTSSSSNVSNNVSSNIIYVYVNNQNKYGDINVLLPEEKIVPAGADVDYTVKAIDSNKSVIANLNFDWSFGDGGEKFGKDVSYHYVYPGEYTLIVSADGYTSGGQAKMKVLVIKPDILIVKVGTNKEENFIDLKNNTGYDLFLSNFYIKVDNQFYKLPKNFIIAKDKTVHVSGEALGFKLPAYNVSLHYPNKSLLIEYINFIDLDFSTTSIISINNNEKILATNSLDKLNISTNIDILNNKHNDNQSDNTIKVQKIEKSEFVKDGSFILKKLVFKEDSTQKDYQKDIESEIVNLEKEEPKKDIKEYVDIGLIRFFKSLIY